MDIVNNTNNRVLKKVKRPINRAPQMPSSTLNVTQDEMEIRAEKTKTQDEFALRDNPFIQQQKSSPSSLPKARDFDLDAFLDENNLPTTQNILSDEDFDFSSEHDDISQRPNDIINGMQISKKLVILTSSALLFLGIIIGKFLFAESKVIRNGLQGVVVNSEVPKGRARCGVAERLQGCVLYIMNPQRQDMNARDFYDLASQLTGRQRFVIETGNMRYANQKIRPGEIAQLNIPPL